MSTHNICFHGEIRKNVNILGMKKGSYLELSMYDKILSEKIIL